MKEEYIESVLHREVVKKGGLTVKLTPVVAGLPDRLVLFRGAIHLVELKTDAGALRPAQIAWHEKASRVGVEVVVLYGIEETRAWVAAL